MVTIAMVTIANLLWHLSLYWKDAHTTAIGLQEKGKDNYLMGSGHYQSAVIIIGGWVIKERAVCLGIK